MKIAVLSGKGGTGKTFISVNMAAAKGKARYIDCDVEEPNGYLFFKPQEVFSREVTVKIPIVDESMCDGCRICIDFCKFNALALIGNKIRVFEEICHSCGGCLLVCPQKAIREKEKVIGRVEQGLSEGVQVVTGILNIGEASGVPIIDYISNIQWDPMELTFIDCPPGSECIVMESIKDADYCILVAEPTLFGVHNLNMVCELVNLFNKPYGVVINKYLDDQNPAEEFCFDKGIDIIGRIPFDKELGAMNSEGFIVARESDKYRQIFLNLINNVVQGVHHEAAINSQR